MKEIHEFPAREITEWQAYEKLTGHLGQERDDLLFAMMTRWVVHMNSTEKKMPPLKEFMPGWDREELG